MKCSRCNGLGGGYETCEGIYPHLEYSYVDIGDCTKCSGLGEIDDIEDFDDCEELV
jgi:hypothetical protein